MITFLSLCPYTRITLMHNLFSKSPYYIYYTTLDTTYNDGLLIFKSKILSSYLHHVLKQKTYRQNR